MRSIEDPNMYSRQDRVEGSFEVEFHPGPISQYLCNSTVAGIRSDSLDLPYFNTLPNMAFIYKFVS